MKILTSLPKTATGKLQRSAWREVAVEAGLR
jgi:acyl-coenzyme A synthetase/AMP-(fatty) acid ligase